MPPIYSKYGRSKATPTCILPMLSVFALMGYVCVTNTLYAQTSVDIAASNLELELNSPLNSPLPFAFGQPTVDAQEAAPLHMGEPSSQSSQKARMSSKQKQPQQMNTYSTDAFAPDYSPHQVPGYTGEREKNTSHDAAPDQIGPHAQAEPEQGILPHDTMIFDISDLLSSESLPKTYEETLGRGNLNEQLSLAQRIIDGGLTSDNIRLALVLYKKAGEHKPEAYHQIGNLLNENAVLLKVPINSAVTYWRLAAAKGYAPSMRSLGLAYRDGNIIEKNLRAAVHYLRKAYDYGTSRLGDEFALEREEAALAKLETNEILSRCAQFQHEACPLVPVLYATNRLPQDNISGRSSFGDEMANLTYFGWSMWAIPEREQRKWYTRMWMYLKEATFGEQEVVPEHQTTTELKEEQFFALVRKLLAASDSKEGVVVYVHGYNSEFDDAASRTAGFAYSMGLEGVPIVFSWPSLGKRSGYFADEERLELSCPPFVGFLNALSKSVEYSTPIQIVAHSMGADLVFDSLTSCSGSGEEYGGERIGEIILAAPDLAVEKFKLYAQKFAEKSHRVTIYVSENDLALKASAVARNNKPRLGYGGEVRVVIAPFETVDTTEVGGSLEVGHAYVFQHERVIEDSAEILRHGLEPDCRTWTIRVQDHNTVYWEIREGAAAENQADCDSHETSGRN